MGREALSQVAKKAMDEPEFRAHLLRDPAGAANAGGFDLSDEDLEKLKSAGLDRLAGPELMDSLARIGFGG
jgi:hypothetical protein